MASGGESGGEVEALKQSDLSLLRSCLWTVQQIFARQLPLHDGCTFASFKLLIEQPPLCIASARLADVDFGRRAAGVKLVAERRASLRAESGDASETSRVELGPRRPRSAAAGRSD